MANAASRQEQNPDDTDPRDQVPEGALDEDNVFDYVTGGPVEVRIGGNLHVGTLQRKTRILDDDLPEITKAYDEFCAKHPDPGK